MSPLTKKSSGNLFDILVAVAWIDGKIQPEEKAILSKIAKENNLEFSEDLLNKNSHSSSDRCYHLLQEYLGEHPTPEDYQHLLTAVSSLIYSDSDIATEEASLLTQMQSLEPKEKEGKSPLNKLIANIQKLYRHSINS